MIEILKDFISKKLELLKMEATEKTVIIFSFFAFLSIITIVFLLFVLLVNIGLGLWIGNFIGNYAYGILIMAAFYLIIIVITFLSKKIIKRKVANFILQFLNS